MNQKPQAGDLIYFGLPDKTIFFDGAFRVLDAENTNTGTPGMFLLCENLISRDTKHGYFFRNEPHPDKNCYRGSDAKRWCSDFSVSHFDTLEQTAMIPTYKSDGAYVKIHTWELLGGKTRDVDCPFVAEENVLDGDRVFLLSTEEAASSRYGFPDHASRLAGLDGKAAAWWLRSPHAPDFPIDVGLVFFNGWLLDFTENKDTVFGTGPVCMRPAFNLDTTKVQSFEAIADGQWLVKLSGETDEAFRAKRSRYTTGTRKPIEGNQEATGFAKFITDLCITVFIGGVELYRKITGQS